MPNIIGLGANPTGGGGNVQDIKTYNSTDDDILANSFSITPDTGYNSIQNITVNTASLKKNFKYIVQVLYSGNPFGSGFWLRVDSTNKLIEISTLYMRGWFLWLPCNNDITIYSESTGNSNYPYFSTLPTINGNATLVGGGLNKGYCTYKISGNCLIQDLGATMCIIAGTLITLADGTKKPVENITYEDNLLVWDFYNGCFSSAKPRWIKVKQTSNVYNKLTFDNGTTLGLVGEGKDKGYHRIFNKQAGRFTHTGVPETPDGTITFAEDVSEPILLNQELIYDTVDYYNIITDKHFNLFANGILTSSKCSNLYHIENMNYVGERLISDEEVESYFKEHKNLQLNSKRLILQSES